MLPDALQQLVREAGGDALLLDARNSRGIITDTTQLSEICRRLHNGGFTRLIDFCARHDGAENYTLYLTLRHPAAEHAALTLKWQHTLGADIHARHRHAWRGPAHTADAAPLLPGEDVVPGPAVTNGAPGIGALSATGNGAAPEATYNERGGAGQPGGQPQRAGFAAHPTLSRVWRAAGLCEREMFELLGIPFAGNEQLTPLFLEDSFYGNPLRNDFELYPAPDYAAELLAQRHHDALLNAPAPEEGAAP